MSDNMCPNCGSETLLPSGRFGADATLICKDCGYSDLLHEKEPEDFDEVEDMPMKKLPALKTLKKTSGVKRGRKKR